MKTLKFIKDSVGKWYVFLPEWTGPKEDLEMVAGADVMLEILSQGDNTVIVSLSEKPFENYRFTLDFIKEEANGGIYNYKSHIGQGFDIWLCYVTKFVYEGRLPEKLYGI